MIKNKNIIIVKSFTLHMSNCFLNNYYINWRDVQSKNGVNNIDMSSLRTPWQNGPYKKQTQRTTQKHVENQDATDIQKKTTFLIIWIIM